MWLKASTGGGFTGNGLDNGTSMTESNDSKETIVDPVSYFIWDQIKAQILASPRSNFDSFIDFMHKIRESLNHLQLLTVSRDCKDTNKGLLSLPEAKFKPNIEVICSFGPRGSGTRPRRSAQSGNSLNSLLKTL